MENKTYTIESKKELQRKRDAIAMKKARALGFLPVKKENKIFRIEAGAIVTTYEAKSKDSAVEKYIKDAGYSTLEDAADVCGQTVEEFLSDITVTEVE